VSGARIGFLGGGVDTSVSLADVAEGVAPGFLRIASSAICDIICLLVEGEKPCNIYI